jgi:hypothetical protein
MTDTGTKGELFNIIFGLIALLAVLWVVITPEARKLVMTKPYEASATTKEKIWGWVGLTVILLNVVGWGLVIIGVIVEIILWIVSAVYS